MARSAPPIGYTPEGWRDAGNYPPRQSTPMRRWAAEFLLRNADFQAALVELRTLWPAARHSNSPYRRRAQEVAQHFGLYGGWQIQFRRAAPIVYPSFKVAPFWLDHGGAAAGSEGLEVIPRVPEWGAPLVFDLRKPIAPQMRVAEQMLKRTGRWGLRPLPGAQRNRRPDHLGMLRVLDARSVGAKGREIARVLFPKLGDESGLTRVRDFYKQAVRLRDGGYRDLPSLDVAARAEALRRGP